MSKLRVLITTVVFVLAGCSGHVTPWSNLEGTKTPLSTLNVPATTTPSRSPIFTPTRLSPTLTSAPTVSPTLRLPIPTATRSPTSLLPTTTPTIPSEARLRLQCLEVVPELPGNADVRDIIVLEKLGSLETWLWNMETGSRLSLHAEGVGGYDYRVSPNGQWIAYVKNTVPPSGAWIAIASTDGQERAVIPWEKEWRGISHWLDNQRLIPSGLLVPGDDYSPVVPLLILNPFTGERQELPPAPPDLYNLYPDPNWLGMGMISYDPALRYRVYPNQNYDLVFEDLQTHEILTQFLVPIWDAVPRWSPDGQQFVITKAENYTPGPVDYELYNVSIDG